jgi:hypothetical protein
MSTRSIVQFLLSTLVLAGCGGPLTYAVHGSPQAPEADVKIVADVHKDASFTTLKIEAEHLAPPDRLGEGTCFIVWTKDDKPKWHRVAALQYDASSRQGKLEGASVPVKSFDFKITSEKTQEPEIPSDFVIATQHVN